MKFEKQYCLGLLAEEAGEIVQLVGKSFRFGTDTPGRLGADGQVSGQTPRTLFPSELGDMLAAIEFAVAHGVIDGDAIRIAKERKLSKLLNPASLDNLGRPLAPQPKNPSPQPNSRGTLADLLRLIEAMPRTDRGFSWESRDWQGNEAIRAYGENAKVLKFILDNTDQVVADLRAVTGDE